MRRARPRPDHVLARNTIESPLSLTLLGEVSPGSGPESVENLRFPQGSGSPDPPRDPRGRGGARKNMKNKVSLPSLGDTFVIVIVGPDQQMVTSRSGVRIGLLG